MGMYGAMQQGAIIINMIGVGVCSLGRLMR